MRPRRRNMGWLVCLGAGALLACLVSLRGEPPTRPASTQAVKIPDVVMLDQLYKSGMNLYQPVPFAHRMHAEMAQMWNGCTTCHHRTPNLTAAATQASAPKPGHVPSQAEAAAEPACHSCHPIVADKANIRMPSLKGAYHRQCLNCHREWMGANACVICHAPRPATQGAPAATAPALTPGDIVGRMHKPIPEPVELHFVARYAPVGGPNVLFRHDEHVKEFGIKCAACHWRDTCGDCHSAAAAPDQTTTATSQSHSSPEAVLSVGPRPMRPGNTWYDIHVPCVSCHQNDRCIHCHYATGQSPLPPFAHAATGQSLDAAHAKLAVRNATPTLRPPNGPPATGRRATSGPCTSRRTARVRLSLRPRSPPAARQRKRQRSPRPPSPF